MSQANNMTQPVKSVSKEKQKKNAVMIIVETFAVLLCAVFFLVPFYFIIVNSMKTSADAAKLSIAWPTEFRIWDNLVEVIRARDYMVLTAFFNSTVITVVSIILLIIVGSMAAFVLHRRVSKLSRSLSGLFLAGLMIPP